MLKGVKGGRTASLGGLGRSGSLGRAGFVTDKWEGGWRCKDPVCFPGMVDISCGCSESGEGG